MGFSQDGRIAAVGDERNIIHLIDTVTFEELALLEPPDLMPVADTPCFVDDGTLAVFTSHGALLQLWDLQYLRSTLASMKLDWDHPPIPPASASAAVKPLNIEADLGFFQPHPDCFPRANNLHRILCGRQPSNARTCLDERASKAGIWPFDFDTFGRRAPGNRLIGWKSPIEA